MESEPALNVTSVVHTITVHKVTNNNTAFVQWDSDFSNDATSEVLLDRCVLRNRCWPRREFCWRTSDVPIPMLLIFSKYKKLEAFNDLAGFFA